MVAELCPELHSWFEVERRSGSFRIVDGMLEADFLLPGQYFRVMGSIFNDGVHQYGTSEMNDEDFTGSVWALAIPKAVINLAQEIQEWRSKYEEAGSSAMSPFTSESFGGYSYSKGSGSAAGSAVSWRNAFAPRMNAWRKVR